MKTDTLNAILDALMKRIFLLLFALLAMVSQWGLAQNAGGDDSQRPFAGHFYCKETGTHLYLNLYEASLTAPGFSFLGKMNGYMNGDIYGTWMLISHKLKGAKAQLRFSNDIGSDSQNIDFVQQSDSVFTYQAVGGNAIRKAKGRNLVKVPDHMSFRKLSSY